MDIAAALKATAKRARMSATQVAAAAGVTEAAARRWMNGTSEPRLAQYQALRKNIPGFAELVDSDDPKSLTAA